jgi:sec-independent protein translocase protein TatC
VFQTITKLKIMPLDQTPYYDYNDEEVEEGKEMTFIEHLEELRWHLIRAFGAIFAFMIISFIFIKDVYRIVILGPSRADFWTYQKMCEVGRAVGIESLCVGEMKFSLQSIELAGQFMLSLTSSAILGLVFAFPYAFWEIWRFVTPGLKMGELKAARGAVFYVTLLFFTGILFGYFIVAPFAINFLVNYQIDPSIQNQFDIGSYLSVLVTLTLACGITFQLPVAIFVLTKIGVVGPVFLRTYRKHAMIAILVVAAIITPSPDMISQILVAIPLYFLYEISIGISGRVVRAKEKALK